MSTGEFKPICLGDQLLMPEDATAHDTVVVTLWSRKELVYKEFKEAGGPIPAVFGQLYSDKRGIDPLLRNLLANPHIKRVYVYGQDLAGSGKKLLQCIQPGPADHDVVTPEVWCRLVDLRVSIVSGVLPEPILPDEKPPSLDRERSELPVVEPECTARYPGPSNGAVVRGRTLGEVWLKILKHIRTYGEVSGTQFGSRQQEIFGLKAVWSGAVAEEWVPVEGVYEYAETLMTAEVPEGVHYTYGQRMLEPINQVEATLQKMLNSHNARDAVIGLWRPEEDAFKLSGNPCVIAIQFRIVRNRFEMEVIIRSNDMFGAWPYNAAGLRRFQASCLSRLKAMARRVREATGDDRDDLLWLKMGDTITESISAHFYEDCWAAADEILAKRYDAVCGRKARASDPFGNWIIGVVSEVADHGDKLPELTIKGGMAISATLIDAASGDVVKTFHGRTAVELAIRISPYVQSPAHALYLGGEAAKAEMAARLGVRYTQDSPLQAILRSRKDR